ncbi:AhpC/TSA family protein [Bowmanella sp. Y26]|uniref:peroxiredoxin-like family protein n=1 Tax=Bowmanella yangjiangensis TaxID=2811230 RepID=UPI001BDCF89F|nr:peroxiredoxin-like family protein [Bowmanella yangjiangensis]MBT1064094.1 AhpC/TSA family protein [Bowmanella yangjiangensis]
MWETNSIATYWQGKLSRLDFCPIPFLSGVSGKAMMDLRVRISEYKQQDPMRASSQLLDAISRSLSLLQHSDVKRQALKEGDVAPQVRFKDLQNQLVLLSDLLTNGPLILSFYRGGWCPYCVLELKAWHDAIAACQQPVNFVAVTPEIAVHAKQTHSDNNLQFPILVDSKNQAANQFGLTWHIDDDMRELMEKWHIDLTKRNCTQGFELPIPATYVLGADGRILYAFIEEDYTQRAEPAEVLAIAGWHSAKQV